MEERTMNRAELRLHSVVSDEISLATARDMLQSAASRGCTALAITDLNSVQSFPELSYFRNRHTPEVKLIYGASLEQDRPVTILAKNRKGLKALYQIISALETTQTGKRCPLSFLTKHRKHLLLGTGIGKGSLYDAIKNNKPLQRLAAYYDYIELLPEFEPQISQKLYRLGKELGIPVVAAGNCHCVFPHHQDYTKAYLGVRRGKPTQDIYTHLRDTAEMLELFSYLGEEAAYEVVVTNPNRLAEEIEAIDPMAADLPAFTLPKANETLRTLCTQKLEAIYGQQPPRQAVLRLEEELGLLENSAHGTLFLLSHYLTKHLQEKGVFTGYRAAVGSTLIAYLLGISDISPLPAHHLCPECKHTEFVPAAFSGYDLPKKNCPHCGAAMRADGHNIPYETCLGPAGDLNPDIDINVPAASQADALGFLVDYLGEDRVAFGGSTRHLRRKVAESYLRVACHMFGTTMDEEELKYAAETLSNLKESDSYLQHAIMLLPENMQWEEITPLRTLNPAGPGGICHATHLSHLQLYDIIPKLDVLPLPLLDRLQALFAATGVKPEDVDYQDPQVYALCRDLDTNGIPEFHTDFVKRILPKVDNMCFSNLVKVSGMAHGTDVWCGNAENIWEDHLFCELVATRDDIFLTLREYGLDQKTAYTIMTTVRKGRFMQNSQRNSQLTELMENAGVHGWYISSLKRIAYLFPKAHAAHYVKMSITAAWFKVHYPEAFYNVTLKHLDAAPYLTWSEEQLQDRLESLRFPDRSEEKEQQIVALLLEARRKNIPLTL